MISSIVLRLADAEMMYDISVKNIDYNKINCHSSIDFDWNTLHQVCNENISNKTIL